MAISNWMVSLALVNGTAGGIVLVLPIIGLEAGWLMIPILIFIASLCCFHTAAMMFRHLGNAQTINRSIMNHFSSPKFCTFYNLTMFLSFFGEMLLYYNLLVSQSQGILYFIDQNVKWQFPYYVAFCLILLALVTRFFHFEDHLLGYGILSMMTFCIFIAWIIIDRNQGEKTVPIAKDNFINLGAAMSQGYSIHNMMIPIILRARDPRDYRKILTNVFVIAAVLYTFIAYGSFAIINRKPISGDGQTVQDYFSGDQWQIYLLRGIYIFNIITVFPGFMSISRIRFFNLFYEQQSRQSIISFKQVIYYLVIIGVCLLAKILNLRATTIIQLNGSIICFMQIYLIPVGIHLKCIWRNFKEPEQTQFGIQHMDAHRHNSFYNQKQLINQKQNIIKSNINKDNSIEQNRPHSYTCPCHYEVMQKSRRHKEILISLVIFSYGVFVMCYTLYTVFFKHEE